ncbi:adhesion G protein-coupled receptor E1-like [Amia ocellicauda]|uniref:adhesion G protein-coupled receptor E1-like n=1 Tax=Amia ocellicauda TaxID=2972642 RepID=UPI0034647A02
MSSQSLPVKAHKYPVIKAHLQRFILLHPTTSPITNHLCSSSLAQSMCEAKLPRYSLLRADFLKTENVTEMFSDVVSGRIAKTPITNLSEPVNFTLKHKMSKADNGLMTCVYWKVSGEEQFWSVEGCTATFSNATYTVCSCTHLSTFALIMQTERVVQNDDLLDQINKVLVIIGLFFFALAIITFVCCRWNPKINNTARLNLCICLFLAHLIFLVAVSHTENKVICSIIAGVLHYLFLSAFVWMLLESIQLFLLVRSLTKVRIIHREGLRPLYLLLIGYSMPVVVVGVSAGLFPRGYGDDKICWLKNDKGFKWTFLGPVCCILAVNLLLFGTILWNVRSTLVNMKSDVSQVKDTRIIIFKAIVQFVILGCGWLLGFFPGTPLLSYLFIVLNSQQGTFIFIVHCLLNKEVKTFLLEREHRLQQPTRALLLLLDILDDLRATWDRPAMAPAQARSGEAYARTQDVSEAGWTHFPEPHLSH